MNHPNPNDVITILKSFPILNQYCDDNNLGEILLNRSDDVDLIYYDNNIVGRNSDGKHSYIITLYKRASSRYVLPIDYITEKFCFLSCTECNEIEYTNKLKYITSEEEEFQYSTIYTDEEMKILKTYKPIKDYCLEVEMIFTCTDWACEYLDLLLSSIQDLKNDIRRGSSSF